MSSRDLPRDDNDVPEVDEDRLREDIMEFDQILALLQQTSSAFDDIELGDLPTPATADDDAGDGGSGDGEGGGAGNCSDEDDHEGAADPSTSLRPNGSTSERKKRGSGDAGCCGRCRQIFGRFFSLVKTDVGLFILLLLYSVLGAALLHATEFGEEHRLKAELESKKLEVVADIMNVTNYFRSGDDEATSRQRRDTDESRVTAEVEKLVVAYASAKESLWPYTNSPGWSYTGAFYFCGTLYTTVGYGNVYPLTDTGRIITIVYAAFGIPICLVLLANLGKTMTRFIKFLWSFVRRFYYTGDFRRRRHMVPLARLRLTLCQRIRLHLRRRTWHRQALRSRGNGHRDARAEAEAARVKKLEEICVPYEVDDNFNLPPIVALIIAFLYMFIGTFIYSSWEDWSYLHAFYFTFISLSTIGLGDIVPEHPRFFLATGFYLLLGLALLAMVINVFMVAVHVTLSKATDHVKTALAEAPQLVRRIQHHEEAAPPSAGSATWGSIRRRSI